MQYYAAFFYNVTIRIKDVTQRFFTILKFYAIIESAKGQKSEGI